MGFKFIIKKENINQRTVIYIITIIVFLISFFFWSIENYKKTERIFFFPEHQSGINWGENRKNPRSFINKEKNIYIFVSELLLGPINMKLDPIFPIGTRVEKLLFRNRILYIDLNFKAIISDTEIVYGFEKGIIFLKKNIEFNFPYIKKIVITIIGEEPISAVISEK